MEDTLHASVIRVFVQVAPIMRLQPPPPPSYTVEKICIDKTPLSEFFTQYVSIQSIEKHHVKNQRIALQLLLLLGKLKKD